MSPEARALLLRIGREGLCYCREAGCAKPHDPCRDAGCYHTFVYPDSGPGGCHHSPECLLGPSPTFNHPDHIGKRRRDIPEAQAFLGRLRSLHAQTVEMRDRTARTAEELALDIRELETGLGAALAEARGQA